MSSIELTIAAVIAGYLVYYLVKYFWPLLQLRSGPSFERDLDRLKGGVAEGVMEAEEGLRARVPPGPQAVQVAVSTNGAGDPPGPHDADGGVFEDDGEWADFELEGTWSVSDGTTIVEEGDGGDDAPPPQGRPDAREATRRLRNLSPLQADYSDRWVREAATQLRLRFPDGEYHAFDLTLLPSYNAFRERAVAARNAASLFVLFGLLGTMVKLNDVVWEIGGLASASGVTPDDFISGFGALLSDVGGAFMASIVGLVLTIVFVVAVGLVASVVEGRLQRLEDVTVQDVVPELRTLHDIYFPPLTLPDLLERTGEQLSALDGTVRLMNTGMATSLESLGGRIEGMLERFGTFERQYVQLNDLLKDLRQTGTSVQSAANKLGAATDKLANPIESFNRELNVTLREHIDVVKGLQVSNDEEMATFRDLITGQQRTSSDLVARIHEAVAGDREVIVGSQREVAGQIGELAATIQAMDNAELARVANSLRSSAELLQASVNSAASSLERSADTMARAAGGFETHAGPPTFFAWSRSAVHRLLDRMRGGRSDSRRLHR